MNNLKEYTIKLLLKNNINKLPVDIFKIKSTEKQWSMLSFKEAKDFLSKEKLLPLCEE